MTDEARKCMESCREWYQAFSNFGKGNERSVKELLTTADLIESLCAELEQVKRERDAAVEEWKQSAIVGKAMCDTCMFSDDEGRCWNDCIDGELWQWRGVKEDREAPTCQ